VTKMDRLKKWIKHDKNKNKTKISKFNKKIYLDYYVDYCHYNDMYNENYINNKGKS